MKSKGLRKAPKNHHFAHPLAKLAAAQKPPAIASKSRNELAALETADAGGSISTDADNFEDLEDLEA